MYDMRAETGAKGVGIPRLSMVLSPPGVANSLDTSVFPLVVHKLVPSLVSITFSFRPDKAIFDLAWQKLVFDLKSSSVKTNYFGFWWIRFHTILDIISQNNGTCLYLKWYMSLFSLRFTCLHTLCSVSSWSLPSLSQPTTKISSVMPNTLGQSLNISSFFLSNISPVGVVPNGNPWYLYLPNWHANVVKYDDLSSTFKLWYPELVSIKEIYCTLFNFGNISLSVGPICTSLINT